MISTILVPLENPFQWDSLDTYGFELAWNVPNCYFCEAVPSKVCGLENGSSSKLTCSSTIYPDSNKGMFYHMVDIDIFLTNVYPPKIREVMNKGSHESGNSDRKSNQLFPMISFFILRVFDYEFKRRTHIIFYSLCISQRTESHKLKSFQYLVINKTQ